MAETNQEPVREPTPNTGGEWTTKLDSLRGLLNLGHRGMMLDKIQRQNAIVEETVKGLQAGKPPGSITPSESDMGVNVIGESHNHYHVDSSGSGLAKPLLGLVAAALLGAGGLGAGWAVLGMLPGDNREQPTFVDTDTDTLGIVEHDK